MRVTVAVAGVLLLASAGFAPAAEERVKASPEMEKKALEILELRCTHCHGRDKFQASNFSADEWNAVLQRMMEKGAKLSGDELDVLRHGRPWK